MVEITARAWSQTVFNFRTFLRSWVPGKPQEGARKTWCSSKTGHLFAHVRQILPTSLLADLNLNDTTFLSDKQWTRIAGKELRMWCNRWRLPDRVHSGLMYWMQHQLRLHHRALQFDCHELHREISHDLRVLQGLVFTPADHFPHSLHVACPFAIHVLLDTTFLDVTVFKRCTVGMSSILANLKSRFQSVPKWSRRYSWGYKWSASLPVARVLPKPSKGFAKARPIIACDRCWHSWLTAFLAKGVLQIMTVVFPPGFNMLSVQQTIRNMWHSMMGYPATEPTSSTSMVQQDLIGFFNSVPHDRILQALTLTLHLLNLLPEKWGQPWQEQSLQLSFRNKDSSFRVFRGRRRFAARNTRTIHLEDPPALTDFMLRSSFFQCGTFTFKQIQGASMGSALAPALCTLVASTTEFLWLHNFRNVLLNIGLHTAVRYADNRAFHLNFHTGIRHNAWTQLLLHLEFYGAPILLEDVPEEKFLGTTCSVTQGTITTLQPVDATLLRTLQSVGNREHVLSGFSARARTIIRLTRPMRWIRPQVEDLIEIYQGRGFFRRCLVQIAHRLLKSVGIPLLE